jgi:hypothetical protein
LQQVVVLQQDENSQVPFVQIAAPPRTQQLPAGLLQPVPLGWLVVEHPPLPSQVELLWHEVGTQLYDVPAQAPPVQTSFLVQALPSLQTVLSGLLTTVQPPEPLQAELLWHWLAVQT